MTADSAKILDDLRSVRELNSGLGVRDFERAVFKVLEPLLILDGYTSEFLKGIGKNGLDVLAQRNADTSQ